jgi:hypothetical protein
MPRAYLMDESVRGQIETYQTHLNGLARRGRELRGRLESDPSDSSAINDTRSWQEDCGVTINQLSGGSKAHWLARSFSGAFLKRSGGGVAVEEAAPAEIVQRLLDVLAQAAATLSHVEQGSLSAAPAEGPAPHRFDFVHDPELRPVLEQAYIDSKGAFGRRDYEQALKTSCGILEAIVTDALEHKGLSAIVATGLPAGTIAGGTIGDWSFNTRLAVAEKVGLIRSGCARLPAVARVYRDEEEVEGKIVEVSERDARVTGQVLNVIMRDLDPGR